MALKFAVNNSLSAVTSLPTAIPTGSMTLLQTQTASSSSTIDFTSNIDSTYDSYVFKFINIHPATDGANLTFQGSTNSGSSYGTTITSTAFLAQHAESDSDAELIYNGTQDLAQSTSFQSLITQIGNASDESGSGFFHLFNPSSTTFVKHFLIRTSGYQADNYIQDRYYGGYFNTTSAIDAIQFKMSSGNIDSGVIKLYGVS